MGNPNLLMRIGQVAMETGRRRTIPEAILVEILARLPIRSIVRFKLLCKSLKSIIESRYFRHLFVSLHRNSSCSWSLMFRTKYVGPITEAIGFNGCKTWDLPKSLVSYINMHCPRLPTFKYCSYVASSNGLIWINPFVTPYDRTCSTFVGNPVLRKWVEIPPTDPGTLVEPPYFSLNPFTAMVTRVDEDGIVSSFKLVTTCKSVVKPNNDHSGIYEWRVYVYSSETGLWTFKRLLSSRIVDYFGSYSPVNLNGMLYLRERRRHGSLIAYDFYGPDSDNQCLVIPLPGKDHNDVKKCLSTSGGDVIYIELLHRKLKVWRLLRNSQSESWQLLRDFSIWSIGHVHSCFPIAMNPFDTNIIYLWSQHYRTFVSGNLQTQEFFLHLQPEDSSSSESYMKDYCSKTLVIMLSQFVLPRWMDSVPSPPN